MVKGIISKNKKARDLSQIYSKEHIVHLTKRKNNSKKRSYFLWTIFLILSISVISVFAGTNYYNSEGPSRMESLFNFTKGIITHNLSSDDGTIEVYDNIDLGENKLNASVINEVLYVQAGNISDYYSKVNGSNRKVIVPAGDYNEADGIEIFEDIENLEVTFNEGANFNYTANKSIRFWAAKVENVRISGGVFDAKENNYDTSAVFWFNENSYLDNVVIENVYFRNGNITGIYIKSNDNTVIKNILIKNNAFYNLTGCNEFQGYGIYYKNPSNNDINFTLDNVIISDNIFDKVRFGVNFYRRTENESFGNISNIIISNNIFENIYGEGCSTSGGVHITASTIFGSSQGHEGIVVDSNVFKKSFESCGDNVADKEPIYIKSDRTIVSNNYIEDGGESYIAIHGNQDDILVTGNMLKNVCQTNAETERGIQIDCKSGALVTNNYLMDFLDRMAISIECDEVVVSNNYIVNSPEGIGCFGNCNISNKAYIYQNTFINVTDEINDTNFDLTHMFNQLNGNLSLFTGGEFNLLNSSLYVLDKTKTPYIILEGDGGSGTDPYVEIRRSSTIYGRMWYDASDKGLYLDNSRSDGLFRVRQNGNTQLQLDGEGGKMKVSNLSGTGTGFICVTADGTLYRNTSASCA